MRHIQHHTLRRRYAGVGALSEAELLAQPVATIPETFRNMEALRKKGKLTKLPETIVTLGDAREVVAYLAFRSRITMTARNTIDIQVPWSAMLDVSFEVNARKIFGSRITVRSLPFWDHFFLWSHKVKSLIPRQ